jgi:hypothetical protein
LRIEAPGHARRDLVVNVPPLADGDTIELGAIELRPGTTVWVYGPERPTGAVARLDLRSAWLEADMLSAPLREGVAKIENAPPGKALLTVLDGRELLCERQVLVPAEEPSVTIACDGGLSVEGKVTENGEPVGPGRLTWALATGRAPPAVILNEESALGLRRSRVIGGGRPDVYVDVSSSGEFSSMALHPGRWRVTWAPGSYTYSRPLFVEIPDVEGEVELTLEFSGWTLEGTVIDEQGRRLPRARVENTTNGLVATADSTGHFTFRALSAGRYRLIAIEGHRRSETVEVVLEADRPSDPVELVVERLQDEVTVLVADGPETVAGAFVIMQTTEGETFATTGGEGIASLRFSGSPPQRGCIAVHHRGAWSFTRWNLEITETPVVLEIETGGSLSLAISEDGVRAELYSQQGCALMRLRAILGMRTALAPESDLLITGLPEGAYEVVTGSGRRAVVSIREGRVEAVEL